MYFDKGFAIGNFMFFIVPFIISIMFVFFIIIFIKGIAQWNKNNNSPVLTVDAKIVTKRTEISHNGFNSNDNTIHNTSTSTYYYITFQVESGDRIEFHVKASEYGMLVEGDIGKLTFQGTRYKKFERII